MLKKGKSTSSCVCRGCSLASAMVVGSEESNRNSRGGAEACPFGQRGGDLKGAGQGYAAVANPLSHFPWQGLMEVTRWGLLALFETQQVPCAQTVKTVEPTAASYPTLLHSYSVKQGIDCFCVAGPPTRRHMPRPTHLCTGMQMASSPHVAHPPVRLMFSRVLVESCS